MESWARGVTQACRCVGQGWGAARSRVLGQGTASLPSSLSPRPRGCAARPRVSSVLGNPGRPPPAPAVPWGGRDAGVRAPLKVSLCPRPTGVNVMLRKIAVAAASKPAVEIKQEGDTFYIRTSTSVRTTEINFKVGDEFEEQTVDGRPCKVGAVEQTLGAWCPLPFLPECHSPVSSWIPPSVSDGESPLVVVAGRMGVPPLPLSLCRPCFRPPPTWPPLSRRAW